MRLLRADRILLLCALFAPSVGAADHPPLVSVEATRCTVCHEDLFEGRSTLHPPAEDCTTCHDVTIADGATLIELSDAEPALCTLCHSELEAAVELALDAPHFPVADSCLTCHDPHASGESRLLIAPLQEVCGQCHEVDDLQEGHGGQLTAATDCSSCHQPHGSDQERLLAGSVQHPPFREGSCVACHRAPMGGRVRLRSRGEKLCTGCHGDVGLTEAADGSVHAALTGSRGRAGCLSCHDPHMAGQKKLLVRADLELCGECHSATVEAARAETGHPPAADDCLTCHLPHSSERIRLLNEDPVELCVFCHDVEDEDLVASHLGADLAQLSCLDCHTPHGAGHPKGLAANLHYPVLDGCDTCHDGSFDRQYEDGESALCLMCHDDVGELAEKAEFPHGALDLGRCVDCHNPHASPQAKLVKAPNGGPCFECHDDKAPEEGETQHGVIGLIGCQACHEPHGGDREALLRRTGSELCLSCHDPAAVRSGEGTDEVLLLDRFVVAPEDLKAMVTLRLSPDGQRNHPVAGHRVLGVASHDELVRVETTWQDELTCLSCHDPHKGRYRLLRWQATASFEACIQCHPK